MIAKRRNSRPGVSSAVGPIAKACGQPTSGHTQLEGNTEGMREVLLDDPFHSLVGRSEDGGIACETKHILLARSESVSPLTDEGRESGTQDPAPRLGLVLVVESVFDVLKQNVTA